MLRLLLGLVFAAAAVTGITMGTLAAFGDTEASLGNEISAGTLDLKVDLTADDTDLNTANDSGFALTDLPADGSTKVLEAVGVFPGDSAEATISLHLGGTAGVDPDAPIFLLLGRHNDEDVSCTEPESVEEANQGLTCAASNPGELDNLSELWVWYDYGIDGIPGPFTIPSDPSSPLLDTLEGNNRLDGGEVAFIQGTNVIPPPPLFSGNIEPIIPDVSIPAAPLEIQLDADLSNPPGLLDLFTPGTTYYIGIEYRFPNAGPAVLTDNVAQSDRIQLDFTFEARQGP